MPTLHREEKHSLLSMVKDSASSLQRSEALFFIQKASASFLVVAKRETPSSQSSLYTEERRSLLSKEKGDSLLSI